MQKILGARIFFNSIGAGATLNSIHFQAIFYQLPIEKISLSEYPASVKVLENKPESRELFWELIEILQEKKKAFNLLVSPEKIFIFPERIVARNKNRSLYLFK